MVDPYSDGRMAGVGSGHVNFALTDDGDQRRPFQSQWTVSNLQGDLKAESPRHRWKFDRSGLVVIDRV